MGTRTGLPARAPGCSSHPGLSTGAGSASEAMSKARAVTPLAPGPDSSPAPRVLRRGGCCRGEAEPTLQRDGGKAAVALEKRVGPGSKP